MHETSHVPTNGTSLHLAGDGETAAPEADRSELRARARSVMIATGLSQTEFAASIGLKRASFGLWLGDKYTRPTPELDRTIEAWLREHDGERAGEVEFIATPTAERISVALAHAQSNGDMVCVYGSPGVGKTRAIQDYARQFEHVWIVTITAACAALVPALEEVAESVGIHDLGSGARRLSRAIRSKVRDLHGLIVVDEAQHLSLGAIEELRAIHDATGVGIGLVGNEFVYARLTGGSRAVHFAQIFSRIGLKMYVPHPDPADVRAIAERWGVKDKKALEMLARVARRPGALRSVVKILKLASIGGTVVTAERVRMAMDHLGAEDA